MKVFPTLALSLALLSIGISNAEPLERVATSSAGMVSAAHPEAARAGRDILAVGGNAADAAAAVAYAIAVTEPSLNSIGGRNQIVVYYPDGQAFGIDGQNEMPAGFVDQDLIEASGYLAVSIPGAADGIIKLHSEHGQLPLETVVAPAIELAESGFEVLPGMAERHAGQVSQISNFPGSLYILKTDGTAYLAGEVLRQPTFANTLRDIAMTGGESFYRGRIAGEMAADIVANGGIVTLDDLNQYQALDSRDLRTTYRGYEIIATGPPASGHSVIAALNILENFDMGAADDGQRAFLIYRAIKSGIFDTVWLSSDLTNLLDDAGVDRLISKDWAAFRAAEILESGVSLPATANVSALIDRLWRSAGPALHLARLRSELHKAGDYPMRRLQLAMAAKGAASHTTHFSVVDRDGMAVSATQTLGPLFGSNVATPGLGFFYSQATMLGGNPLPRGFGPGSRPVTSISPTLVRDPDGKLVLVVGAAGGLNIAGAIVSVISAFIDGELPVAAAVDAPRVSLSFLVLVDLASQADGSANTNYEHMIIDTTPTGWTAGQQAEIQATLNERGGVAVVEPSTSPVGRVHAVGALYGPQSNEVSLTGVADPNHEGASAGIAAAQVNDAPPLPGGSTAMDVAMLALFAVGFLCRRRVPQVSLTAR